MVDSRRPGGVWLAEGPKKEPQVADPRAAADDDEPTFAELAVAERTQTPPAKQTDTRPAKPPEVPPARLAMRSDPLPRFATRSAPPAHHSEVWLAKHTELLPAKHADAPPISHANAELARISKKFGVDIVAAKPVFPVKSWYGRITGKPADAAEIDRYAPLFMREFDLYPADLVRRARLKRVVLCKALCFAGQLRAAIPDFEHNTLYLDVVRGGRNPLYLCKVLHHEFFHIIDYRDDGHLYEDARWSSLNRLGFKYGTGGKNAQKISTASLLTDKFPGFLNYYSTTGVEEDKAELFANLVVNSAYVEGRAKTDQVIKKKVQALRELAARFCSDVNDQFWERARKTEALRRTMNN